jgi:4-oxalocrotonate tautomerase
VGSNPTLRTKTILPAYLASIWMLLETVCRNLRGVGCNGAFLCHYLVTAGFLEKLIRNCVSIFLVIVMPFVQVSVWAGMSPENKKKVVEGITKIFESIGVPSQAIHVAILEIPQQNWATGGKLHSETPPPV